MSAAQTATSDGDHVKDTIEIERHRFRRSLLERLLVEEMRNASKLEEDAAERLTRIAISASAMLDGA